MTQANTEPNNDGLTRITTTDGREFIAPMCVVCGSEITTRQYDHIRDTDLCAECLVQDVDKYTDLK